MSSKIQVGDKYRNKAGAVGVVKETNGVKMLEVRNNLGRITQTIVLRKLNLNNFERVEDGK